MPALIRLSSAAVFRVNFLLFVTLLLIASNFGIGRGTKADDAHLVFATNGKHSRIEAVSFGRNADPALLAVSARVVLDHQHRVPIELYIH